MSIKENLLKKQQRNLKLYQEALESLKEEIDDELKRLVAGKPRLVVDTVALASKVAYRKSQLILLDDIISENPEVFITC